MNDLLNFNLNTHKSFVSRRTLDIDECELFNKNSTTELRCVHGDFCSNTIGSWNCTCPKERLWTSVGTPENPIYRCQGQLSSVVY